CQTRHGLRSLWHRGCHGAGDRADAWWVDHRQLQLALDFFCEHPGRNSFTDSHFASDSGPALLQAPQAERNEDRLRRPGLRGVGLLGSTLLLPLFLQTLMGYTAELSGMALSPGGFAIMIFMPIVGWLLSKYDARYLLLFGLSMLSFSLFHMTNFDLNIDFKTAVYARILQAVGLAFLFVPINTAAYAFLPREKNNAASGLMNLARNIGGSVGISFVTTLLDRRTQKNVSQ